MIYANEANQKSKQNRLESIKLINLNANTQFLECIENKIAECVNLGINRFIVNVAELTSINGKLSEDQCRQIVIHYLQDLGYQAEYHKYDRYTLLVAW